MSASKIGYPQKNRGDKWTAQEANEVKATVNEHADEIDALASSVATITTQLYTHVEMKTETTVSISPNVFYRWGEVASLDISFIAAPAGRYSEYMMEFTVLGSTFKLTLPSGVRWVEQPEWESGSTYQVSVVNNLAIAAAWEGAS